MESMMHGLNELKVSPKVKKVLIRNGVSSISELQNKTRDELQQYHGVGPIYAIELEQALKELKSAEMENDTDGKLVLELSKAFVKPVRMFSWCPKYDLVALVLEEPPMLTLEIRRLNWEVLSSFDFFATIQGSSGESSSGASEVTLCWSPDCTKVFIGQGETVYTFDVSPQDKAGKHVKPKKKSQKFSVTDHPFVWASYNGSLEATCKTRIHLLPKLFMVQCNTRPGATRAVNNKEAPLPTLVPKKRDQYPERLQLLVTPAKGGELYYDAFGSYRIFHLKFLYDSTCSPPVRLMLPTAKSHPSDNKKNDDFEIINFSLSEDYAMTTVLLQHKRDDGQFLVCVRHSVLKEMNHEICFVSSTVLEINFLMKHVHDSFHFVRDPWRALIEPFQKRITQFERMMTEAGCSPKSIPAEILRAFTLGGLNQDSIFNQWFMICAKPRKLVSLDAQIGPATKSMGEIVERILIRSVDEILMRLSELLGIAQNKRRCSCLGLTEEGINTIIVLFTRFRQKLYELQILIVTTAKYYHSIIRWLLMLWARKEADTTPAAVGPSSPWLNLEYTPELANDIIHFINLQIFNDNLGNFMAGAKLLKPNRPSEWAHELFADEKRSNLEKQSVFNHLQHAKQSIETMNEFLCKPILESCVIDAAFLTAQCLSKDNCCFDTSFNYSKEPDAHSPQFVAWLPTKESNNMITLFFCQFLVEKDVDTEYVWKQDPWSDEVTLGLKDVNKDSLRFRCSTYSISGLPTALLSSSIKFYNDSTLILLGMNMKSDNHSRGGMIIECPVPELGELHSGNAVTDNIEGCAQRLHQLVHEDEYVALEELRYHVLGETPRELTSTSEKAILAVLGDNGGSKNSQIWIFDMAIREEEDDEEEDDATEDFYENEI